MTDLDIKFIESYFRDRFSRPYARKLRYIYFGLDHTDDIFVLSSTEDTEFKYCDTSQTTSLIKITNLNHLAKIKQWFHHLGIDNTTPMIIYLGSMMTILGKVSWGSEHIVISKEHTGAIYITVKDEPRILIARPIDTYYTLNRLQTYVNIYQSVFFTNKYPKYISALDTVEKQNKITHIAVSSTVLKEAGLLDIPCRDIRIVLIPGTDFLLTKSLIQKMISYQTGITLWADSSPRCINYGGFYTDLDISICVVRDNVFLFPKPV